MAATLIRKCTSARERRLWSFAAVWLLTIYASLYFVQFVLDYLRERNLLRLSIALVFVMATGGLLGWIRRQGAGRREWAVLALVILLYVLLLGSTRIVQERIHYIQYGVLAGLFYAALSERAGTSTNRGRVDGVVARRIAALLAVVLTALCGWLDEGIQWLLPNRVYDLRDVLLNAVAGAIAVAAIVAREWARKKDLAKSLAAPLIALLVTLVLVSGCAYLGVGGRAHPPSVLLLTIDSLRPDHLGTYGYEPDTSPHLSGLARDGVLFRNAFTAGSWTSPGLVSLYTSLLPDTHGVVARGRTAPAEIPSGLKALSRNGYRVPDLFGFQGAHNYQNLGFDPWSGEILPAASLPGWLAEHSGQPALVTYHLRDVHLPYDPKPPYDRYFREALDAGKRPPSAGIEAVRTQMRVIKGSVAFEEEDRPLLEALYDGEVEAQDAVLGAILGALCEHGLYDDLFIIVTADHGEELLDHGFVGHASTNLDGHLHDEVLHIPLVMKFPRAKYAGTTIDTMVRSIDVLPTVLDAVGLGTDPALEGRSLLPLIRDGGGPSPGPVIAATSPCGWTCPEGRFDRYQRAVRTERYKLVEEATGGRGTYELYDLGRDPEERRDIAEREPQIVERLRILLPEESQR